MISFGFLSTVLMAVSVNAPGSDCLEASPELTPSAVCEVAKATPAEAAQVTIRFALDEKGDDTKMRVLSSSTACEDPLSLEHEPDWCSTKLRDEKTANTDISPTPEALNETGPDL